MSSPISSSFRPSDPLITSERVLVTGATSGIGLAVTAALLERGASVVAVGRQLDALTGLMALHRDRLLPLRANLMDSAEVRFVVPRALERGALTGFVSAAGVAHHEELGTIPERSFREQFEVNTFAPMRLGEELVGTLEPGGGMVFVASTLAHRPIATSYVYSATKAALLSAVRSLAAAGAPRNVRVSAVTPGVVDTPMIRRPRAGEEDEADVAERMRDLAALHPLGRVGTTGELAQAVLHLLDAPWTTGAELVVDGGSTIG
jgi:NAD(P)-dependent dehydrogenase (short-subunit alcohol dehydrogenase family)